MMVQSDAIYEVLATFNPTTKTTFYKLCVSKKNKKDNSVITGELNCRFGYGVIISNLQKIKLKDTILDFYNNKNNITIPYLFIKDFELIND